MRQLPRAEARGRPVRQPGRRHLAVRQHRRRSRPDHSEGQPRRDAAVRSRPVATGSAGDGHLHPRSGRAGQAGEDHLQQAGGQRRGHEREGDLPARDGRRGRHGAMGPRLPSRRPHPRHREGREAADHREGPAAARAGHRRAGGARQGPGRAARRRRAPRLPPQRLDLRVVQRPRRERQRDDEDRPRQAEGQRLRRTAGRLQGAGRPLHRWDRTTSAIASCSTARDTSTSASASAARRRTRRS